ncbi:MAG: ATP-binding cassette domain-containing protein [Actinobacteria bacterium]|nr:ATP-binding cassette domain-containing protein [Actinomycetota bacterium]
MSATLTDPSLPEVDPTPEVPATRAVLARTLQLDGKRGRVYGPVDLDIAPGTVTLVTGRAGAGKTSLLLTLVGRMRPNRGSDLVVLGRRLPGRAAGVQRRSTAVGVHGLDDLDEEVTVAATIRERQAWLAPWYRVVRTPDDAAVADLCAGVFGRNDVPRARQLVHELDEAANLQLRLALALLSRPELVVVDDIDALHDTDGRRLVWESLRTLGRLGVTVIAAAASASELSRLGWDEPPHHIALPTLG